MIIGITGTLGAGKGTIVSYLQKKGFRHYSVRDFLTREIERRGLKPVRESMVAVANELRARHGPAYIIEQLYSRAKAEGGNSVIESIRCPGEVEALKKEKDFVLFAVDADVETRYARIVERNSTTDKISFEEFVRQEERELTSNDPNRQNLKKCIEMADYVFKNDWTIEELHKKVESVLEKINGGPGKDYVRPSWDEYFMEIANTVAKRATCNRGRAGCVIVRDKQVLVTGYVGSPKGLPHCDQEGHLMETTIHSDGIARNHCIRTTHAEQNAICQAAKFGISIKGATLYCKMEPCPVCAKMIINSGITRVVCGKRYQSGAQGLMEQAGIKVDVLNEEIERY